MMISLLSISLLGFLLGMRHATDSDHVIAVSTIVTRQRRIWGAALTGVLWGCGHGATLLLAGCAVIYLGIAIPARLGLALELAVALMLILLGMVNLRAFRQDGAAAEGGEGGLDDVVLGRLEAAWGGARAYQWLRPFVVGVVHGLAGSAAVALLVLPLIKNPLWAMAYLAVFGAGTIAGMMLITAAVAIPVTYAAARCHLFHRYAGVTAGMLSIAFGLTYFWHIGFGEGLFTR